MSDGNPIPAEEITSSQCPVPDSPVHFEPSRILVVAFPIPFRQSENQAIPPPVWAAVTVIWLWPVLPSEVAVIVVVPTPAPEIVPLEVTLATAELPEDQVTDLPLNVFPLASRNVTLSCEF